MKDFVKVHPPPPYLFLKASFFHFRYVRLFFTSFQFWRENWRREMVQAAEEADMRDALVEERGMVEFLSYYLE
jgi:hypothetical protein